MKLINEIHENSVHNRRVESLTRHLVGLMPRSGSVLDVGCGDGLLASLLSAKVPNTEFRGIDVLVREQTQVPVEYFDGVEIPHDDNSFDAVMMVDVLHHTESPEVLLREAQRVARDHIILKDHTRDGLLANSTLRFMDWVGNAHHGVALPYNYLSQEEWNRLFNKLNLEIDQWNGKPNMYGKPADWLFGRSLHFVARLNVSPR
jgi:SAM-dependent methyltransferase